MQSLGAILDKNLKIRTLDWATKSGDVKLQDFYIAFGVVANSKNSDEIAWNYYKNNFQYIKDKTMKGSAFLIDAVFVQSVSKFITIEKANEIEKFFQKNPLPESSRRITQTIEQIRSNAKLYDIIIKSNLVINAENIWN